MNSVRIYPNDMEMSGDQVKMTLRALRSTSSIGGPLSKSSTGGPLSKFELFDYEMRLV